MAIGSSTASSIGGAVSDIFAASALRAKARGARMEAKEYDLARNLSLENAQFAETSTAIKEHQLQRSIEATVGQQQADIAANGFAASGTAIDLLRDSVAQGALTKAVAQHQGIIEEDAYKEQAASYALMSEAAQEAARASDKAATGAGYASWLKGAGAGIDIATSIAGMG